MKVLDPLSAAQAAVAPNPSRPATAIVHDSEHARLVVFRISPGQHVPPHHSTAMVILQVLAGSGVLSGIDGLEHKGVAGDTVVYGPGEIHGMRSDDEEFLLLATITPRPGGR